MRCGHGLPAMPNGSSMTSPTVAPDVFSAVLPVLSYEHTESPAQVYPRIRATPHRDRGHRARRFTFPAGTFLYVNTFAANRDPESYQDADRPLETHPRHERTDQPGAGARLGTKVPTPRALRLARAWGPVSYRERMTYVITSACVDVMDKSCVAECPADCIYEGGRTLYINPDECVDCGACKIACRLDAIEYESDLEGADLLHLADNAAFFETVLPGRDTPLGTPGGARGIGRVGVDTPLVAAMPVRETPAH